jgi:ABC-type Fe3+ transport system substrate-binding protein
MHLRLNGASARFVLLPACATLLVLTAACTDSASTASAGAAGGSAVQVKTYTDLAALEAEAKKEGTLDIFLSPDFEPFLVQDFKKAYPWATVNYTGVQPDQAAAKLSAEVNSNLHDTDVAGIYPTAVSAFAAKGQLAKVVVPQDAKLVPAAQDKNNYIHAMTSTSNALVYNTDKIKDPPKTLEALADPKYAGQLVIQTPTGTGTGQQVFAMPYKSMGEAKWTQWLDDVAKNKPFFADSNSTAFAAVLRGDRAYCICNYHDYTNAAKNAPLAALFWDQDTYGALTGGVGAVITAKAPHPAMAALWMNWMLSPDGGQKGMVASGRVSSIVGVAGGDVLPPGTKVANFYDILSDLLARPDYYQSAYKKAFGL